MKQMAGEQDWTDSILAWYMQVRRALPWRQGRDPYQIWISEVMLQQTKVETVIPYYERFLGKFPTLLDLANAPEDEVLKSWEGLGYYSRARHLHAAVKEVAAKYDGHVPETYEHFRALPGVGDYTAGAVLSIGYDVPVPAVDGNVLRVYARFFGMNDNVLSSRVQKRVRAHLQEFMPMERAADFNQAMMELGALICKPKSPQCEQCPLYSSCVAARMKLQAELPVRQKAVSSRVDYLAVVFLQADQKWLVRKRPAKGLLANLWELPHVSFKQPQTGTCLRDGAMLLAQQLGAAQVNDFYEAGEYTHVFSHLTWKLQVYIGITDSFEVDLPYRWIDQEERRRMAFGQIFSKIINDTRGE